MHERVTLSFVLGGFNESIRLEDEPGISVAALIRSTEVQNMHLQERGKGGMILN